MGVMARVGVCGAVGAILVVSLVAASSPAAAQSALLDPLASRVTLTRAGTSDEVTQERIVRSGDTVGTDAAGRALITYPDGSTAQLEESSEITIEFIRTTAGDYLVRMQQTLGRVWYAVSRTVGSGGRYEVRSGALASVIRAGSGSYVAVSGGEATVVATAGSVETSAGGTTVTVPAGSATTVSSPVATPAPPQPAPLVTPTPLPTISATPLPTIPATPRPTAASVPTRAPSTPRPVAAAVTPVPTVAPTATPVRTVTPATTAAASVLPTAKPTAGPTLVVKTPLPVATSAPTKDIFGPRKDSSGPPVLPPHGPEKK